jgi:hypothetical protein
MHQLTCALRLLLQPEGLKEMYGLINFYKENATILKNTFQEMGFEVYGEHQGEREVMTSSSWALHDAHACYAAYQCTNKDNVPWLLPV